MTTLLHRHIRPLLSLLVVSFAGAVAAPAPALACGAETDCTLDDGRRYRVHLPHGLDAGQANGALVFAHGYKGSAAGTLRNKRLLALAEEFGVVLIAVDAKMDDWSLPHAPAQSTDPAIDEVAYIGAVMDDAGARFGVARERTVVAGFSAGGMLTWTVACARGAEFAGYVPVSGVFWAPVPDACATPPGSIIHLHGTADRIVPLAGRQIAEARQGGVAATIGMYARHGGFARRGAQSYGTLGCEEAATAGGRRLDLCLHDGGHSYRIADLAAAIRRLDPPGWPRK